MKKILGILALFGLCIAAPGFTAEKAAVEQKPDLSNEVCLECHGDDESVKKFDSSIHAGNDCISCHDSISDVPHEEKLPRVQCANCHGDEGDKYSASTHGKAFAAGVKDAPSCATCHGTHDILPKSDLHSRIHQLHQIEICEKCHANPAIAGKYNLPPADKIEAYKDSIHGRGVIRSGLLVSATCVSCHTAHSVLPKTDPKSSIYKFNVPSTCGKCHLGILEDFRVSEHGKQWLAGSPKGPGCVTCHGSHSIQNPESQQFQLAIPLLCAKCHEKQAPTYQDSFHGKAISLGFVRAAKCADCHTAHRNLKEEDPNSTVNPAHLQQTCGKCHPGANASFITFDPHANPDDKQSSPLLFYVHKAMILLLYGVFGFFGVHTLLWYQRSIVASRRGEFKKHEDDGGPWIIRFTPIIRFIHILVMVSFLGLAFTGIPIRFPYVSIVKTVVGFLGGIEVIRFFHRVFAIITFTYAGIYLYHLLKRVFVFKERRILYGPDSMVPRWKDIQDLWTQVRWFLYMGKPAKFDRWTYWEKFDYFAVFWGIPVIGLSGLLLWFPGFFTKFLPGYVLNIAKVVHSEEAMLAVGFIFIYHFFHTHLRPESFPMDLVIFTGKMPLSRFKAERPEEYKRLVDSGELDKYLTIPPTAVVRRRSYTIGSIGLAVGIILIFLVILSVLLFE
jgi:cytochrome b subunit of formate dehydrogenase